MRATFIDLPIDSGFGDPSDPLAFTNFGFFGFYLAVGYHPLLGRDFDGSVSIGGSYQNSGDSYRATQFASIEVRRRVLDFIHVGVKLDEVLAAYRFNSDLILTGQAHMLTLRPGFFLDWSF